MNLAQTSTPVTYAYVTDRARAVGFYIGTLGFTVRTSGGHGDTIDMGRSLLHLTPMTVYEGMGQDALGVWSSPDGATKLAWFPDPDGNVLMLSQH